MNVSNSITNDPNFASLIAPVDLDTGEKLFTFTKDTRETGNAKHRKIVVRSRPLNIVLPIPVVRKLSKSIVSTA